MDAEINKIAAADVACLTAACFWSIGDIDFFRENHVGRPARRHSFKYHRRDKRKKG